MIGLSVNLSKATDIHKERRREGYRATEAEAKIKVLQNINVVEDEP